MAKKSPTPEVASAPTEARRLLRSKGPLSASEIEITVFAGVKDGALADTPQGFSTKMRAAPHLISDRRELADAIPHRTLVAVEGEGAFRSRMLEMHLGRSSIPISDREAVIAGSLPIIDAALGDAFRIVLVGDEEDLKVPAFLADWKAGKPDKRSSPATLTLTRV